MKSARTILALAVGVGISLFAYGADVPQAYLPQSAALLPQLSPITSIAAAADPSAAVQAYAEAHGADPKNTAIDLAYIRRMVDFGLPEMADTQARSLVDQHTTEGLPWAVTAYMSAKRQDSPTALTQIAVAAAIAPDDSFVVRTAAQLLAWYDLRADKTQVPPEARAAGEKTRSRLMFKVAFQQAYAQAKDAYTEVAAATQPGSAPTPAASNDAATLVDTPPLVPASPDLTAWQPSNNPYANTYAAPYTPTSYDNAPYPDPYYYDPSANCAPWWPCGYCAGPVWWPNFGSVIVIGNSRFHDHDHDFGDHVHHAFANGLSGVNNGFVRTNSGWALNHAAASQVRAPNIIEPHVAFSRAGSNTVFAPSINRAPQISTYRAAPVFTNRSFAAPVRPAFSSNAIYRSAPRVSAPSFSAPHFNGGGGTHMSGGGGVRMGGGGGHHR